MAEMKPMDGHVVDLGERKLWLRWDLGAVAHFEDLSGEAMGPDFKIGVAHLLRMLYAGSVAHARWRQTDPELTLEEIGTLFDSQEKVDAAMVVLGAMMKEFFGGDKPAKKGKAKGGQRSRAGSAASTRSARSTSASQNKNSGRSRSSSSTPAPSGTTS